MSNQNSTILCTVISEGPSNPNDLPNFARKCCQACAWREEQLRHTKELKLQTSSTDKLLQSVADKILLPPPPENHSNSGLVREVNGPLTERHIRYGNILSHAIQCKTVSYDQDQPHVNEASKVEFLKLHKLLKVSFPCLHEKYPPRIVNDYSLVFKVPADKNGGEEKPIMLCAHLDVVPAPIHGSNNGGWDRDPFGGEILNGIVWGRGAIDNKNNLVAQLGALEEILVSGHLPSRTVFVTCGHDEEIGGLEGAKRIAELLEGDNTGPFEFIHDEGTMMVSGAIPGYTGPLALIGCAEKGCLNIELSVTGPGGHSSIPPIDRDNPLKIMSKAIVAIESNPIPAHFERNTLFRSALEHIAWKLKFPFNILCSNFWLFGPLFKNILLKASNGAAASIRTTTAVTKMFGGEKINAMPTEVKAYVNHRVHPSDSFESILEHDRRVINDDRIKMKMMEYHYPVSPISGYRKTLGFATISTCVEKVFGFQSTPFLCVGNTDTRWYWNLSKCIYRFSPIALTIQETSMFHGVNERIGVDSLTLMVDYFKEIMLFD